MLSAAMLPLTELLKINNELVLELASKLPPILLPGQESGAFEPICTAAALPSKAKFLPTVVPQMELLALPLVREALRRGQPSRGECDQGHRVLQNPHCAGSTPIEHVTLRLRFGWGT